MANIKIEITGEEVVRISQLLAAGKSSLAIQEITGRSVGTVNRIKRGLGYPIRETNSAEHRRIQQADLYKWLRRHWNWKPPEEQRLLLIRKAKNKRRIHKPSQFRTPYWYPRMWPRKEDK